jgi:hypothetical protein
MRYARELQQTFSQGGEIDQQHLVSEQAILTLPCPKPSPVATTSKQLWQGMKYKHVFQRLVRTCRRCP